MIPRKMNQLKIETKENEAKWENDEMQGKEGMNIDEMDGSITTEKR